LNNYEGMFLFDPAATTDWEQIKTELDRLMGRSEARMIAFGKWDERRLAYEIRGRKRAIYVLTYFAAEPDKISNMERDVRLSESVIRCLILRMDHLSEDEMKQIIADSTKNVAPPAPAPAPTPEPKADSEDESKAESKGEAEPADAPVTADVVDDTAPAESVSSDDSHPSKEE